MRSLLCLVLLSIPLAAGNLLRNPGFEEVADGRPVAWTTEHAWFAKPKESGLARVEVDTSRCQGPGRSSLRIVGSGNRGVAQQVLTVQPDWGTRFRLAGWVRLQDTGSACARIDAECHDADGKFLGSPAALATDWRQSTADWQQLAKEFDLPANARTLRVHCSSDRANSGTVWFDNLVLEPVGLPAPEPAKAVREVEPLIPLDDFESDEIAWSGNAWGGAAAPVFTIRPGGAPVGERSLRIEFPSAKNSMADRTWTHQGDWDGISLWVRRASGKGGVTLYAMCGAVVFHAKWIRPTDEWVRVTVRAEELRYAWGAKDEREKIFDRGKVTKLSFGHEDVVAFDIDQVAVDLDDGLALTRAYCDTRANLFAPGERPTIHAEVLNAGREAVAASLQFELLDAVGTSLERIELPLDLPPRGRVLREVALAPLSPGYCSARVRLFHKGAPLGERSVGICTLPPPDPAGRAFMGASGFGMGAGNADIGARMGVRAAEVMLTWALLEPEPGAFRFEGAEEALAAFEGHGMEVTGMILLSTDRIPKWARPTETDPRGAVMARSPEDFARFVRALGERFGSRIGRWSYACEIDLLAHRLAGGTDQYVELVQAGTRALREAVPNVVVGGVGVSGGDGRKKPRFPVARALWERLGDDLDGMFFDAYASPRYYGPGLRVVEPEENDLAGILRDALALVRTRGEGKRVAIEEKGWAIDRGLPVDSPEAMAMAACLARSFLLARSVDEVEHYMWFQLDTGWGEGGYSYSLFRREFDRLNPLPGVAAYAAVARFLAGAEAPRRVALHGDLYALVFGCGDGSRAALWTPLDSPVRLHARLPATVRATTFLGAPCALPDEAEGIALSRQPIYLEAPGTGADDLAARLGAGRFALPCARLSGALASTGQLEIQIRNLLSIPLAGQLTVTMPAGWESEVSALAVAVPAGGIRAFGLKLTRVPTPLPERPGIFALALAAGAAGTVRHAFEPTVHPVPCLARPPVVDGDLAEFAALPSIRLADHTYLDPPDAPSAKLWTGVDDLSAEFWLAWSAEGLHVAARVRDDVFVQEQTGASIWANDSIQIGIDAANNACSASFAGTSGYDGDDAEFGIALTPKGPETYQWTGSPDGAGRVPPGVQLAVKRVGDTTVYEWTCPWSLLRLTPVPGRVFGFNAVFLDSDQKGKTARYWLGLTPGICGGKDPGAFHDFVLLAP